MIDEKETSASVIIFETALSSKEPIKKLFEMAADSFQKGDMKNLWDIDVMLSDRFIEYLRTGTFDELNEFKYALLAFIDTQLGDQLKESEEGKRYYYRWAHFHDLCEMAIENYDPQLTKRFIQSRKHGKELMTLLYKYKKEGLRHNELAQQLGISPPHLSKLLREFIEHELITRERQNKFSIIRLSIIGNAYMKENQSEYEMDQDVGTLYHPKDYPYDTQPAAVIASGKDEYISISPEFSRPMEFFFGPGE